MGWENQVNYLSRIEKWIVKATNSTNARIMDGPLYGSGVVNDYNKKLFLL